MHEREHRLRVVGELARSDAGDVGERLQIAGQLFRNGKKSHVREDNVGGRLQLSRGLDICREGAYTVTLSIRLY